MYQVLVENRSLGNNSIDILLRKLIGDEIKWYLSYIIISSSFTLPLNPRFWTLIIWSCVTIPLSSYLLSFSMDGKELILLEVISLYLLITCSSLHLFISLLQPPIQHIHCISHLWLESKVWIEHTIPVSNSVSEILVWYWHTIVLLTFLNFDFDLIIFSKVCDLLYLLILTLESMHPFLTPYLFMATKFLGGSFTFDPSLYCQPDTTT